MATIVRSGDRDQAPDYEPPLIIGFGINDKTVENPTLTMGHTVVPPGARNQAHYHANAPAAFYLAKGKLKVFIGPPGEQQEETLNEGEFVYVEPGEIHGIENLSDSEEALIIFTYSGVPNKEAAGTTFVEDRHDL